MPKARAFGYGSLSSSESNASLSDVPKQCDMNNFLSDSSDDGIFSQYHTQIASGRDGSSHDGYSHNDIETWNLPNVIRSLKNINEERRLAQDKKNKLKEEKLKERRRKAEARDCAARMKPGNCMKYIKVGVDFNLTNEKYGGEILQSIVQCGSSHRVMSQPLLNTITWTRTTMIESVEIDREEDVVLLLWNVSQLIGCIERGSLLETIESALHTLINKKLTLAVFELDSYLIEQEKCTKRNFKRNVANEEWSTSQDCNITRDVVEESLTEIQVVHGISTFSVNTPEEVGGLVSRFTKSIAETPYKLEMQQKQVDALGWSAASDLRNSVRVDKFGNGLKQLWLQQLTQFNNSGLDVAQAILLHYPTPLTLYKAYLNCESKKMGEQLLKNIIIRRSLGEAAATRKVGPELSKKIFHFFTIRDGNYDLSQE